MNRTTGKQLNYFHLTDKSRDKTYRFSYDKSFSIEEKMKWRERWQKGEIELVCGCGKAFAINRAGAIYYPVKEAGVEQKPHGANCSRGKNGKSTSSSTSQKKERKIVLILPKIPTHPNQSCTPGCEERLLAEKLVEPYPFTTIQSIKNKTGRKWVELEEKQAHINSVLVESLEDLRLKKAGEDPLLLIRPIASLEEERYGFVKLNLLDIDGKSFPVWVKGDMMKAMIERSGIKPALLLNGKDLSDRFWLAGTGYIREEKWKTGVFRKTYLIRGGILQVRWN
jgi:hypothetical protein